MGKVRNWLFYALISGIFFLMRLLHYKGFFGFDAPCNMQFHRNNAVELFCEVPKQKKRKRKVLQIQEMTPESDSIRPCCAELGDAFCYAFFFFFPMMMKDWPSPVWGREGPSSSWCTACIDPTSITLWVPNCSINKWVEAGLRPVDALVLSFPVFAALF